MWPEELSYCWHGRAGLQVAKEILRAGILLAALANNRLKIPKELKLSRIRILILGMVVLVTYPFGLLIQMRSLPQIPLRPP